MKCSRVTQFLFRLSFYFEFKCSLYSEYNSFVRCCFINIFSPPGTNVFLFLMVFLLHTEVFSINEVQFVSILFYGYCFPCVLYDFFTHTKGMKIFSYVSYYSTLEF